MEKQIDQEKKHKVVIKQVNEPDGRIWFGTWVDDVCECSSPTLEDAETYFSKVVENFKNPEPRYQILKEETV